jgi:hypothetical protein
MILSWPGRGMRLWGRPGGLEQSYDAETVACPSGVTHFTVTRTRQ